MPNSNIADISTFESLQNNQNERTGQSAMSAFQADVSLTNAKYKETRKLTPDEQKEADALKKAIAKAESDYNAIRSKSESERRRLHAEGIEFEEQKKKELDAYNKQSSAEFEKTAQEQSAARATLKKVTQQPIDSLQKLGVATEIQRW